MKIILEPQPRITIEKPHRGLVILWQTHESPTGPIPTKNETWVRASSTLEVAEVCEPIIEHLREHGPTFDEALDELLLATAEKQGGHAFRMDVARKLSQNGGVACELRDDGSVEVRAGTMFAQGAKARHAVEGALFDARVRSVLTAEMPGHVRKALAAELAKPQIASALDLPPDRNGRGRRS